MSDPLAEQYREAGDAEGSVKTPTPDDVMMLDGIPSSIPWERVCKLIESLGIDPKRIPSEPGLTIGWRTIECDVFAHSPSGQMYINDRNEIATHRVSIPVVLPEGRRS